MNESYPLHVFYDKLISPVNGYVCRQINKQNVRNFGFDDMSTFKSQLPGFPTRCEQMEETRSRNASINSKIATARLQKSKQDAYAIVPALCKHCDTPLSYGCFVTGNKFCGSSCSASHNNAKRERNKWTPEQKHKARIKAHERLPPKDPSVPSHWGEYCTLFTNLCKKTGIQFLDKTYRKYHPSIISDSHDYRRQCKFNFSLRSFPKWFDLRLLVEHGMYSTPGKMKSGRVNPRGVSRDHMISVTYGWLNDIEPSLISHPANCKLMLHSDNSSKGTSNIITVEELKEQIVMFESIYPDWNR